MLLLVLIAFATIPLTLVIVAYGAFLLFKKPLVGLPLLLVVTFVLTAVPTSGIWEVPQVWLMKLMRVYISFLPFAVVYWLFRGYRRLRGHRDEDL